MQSKISNVGEKILNEMSSSSDGEKDTADRTDLNEARNNVKPFSVRAEYAKKLDDNKDGIRAKLRDLE